MEGGREGEKQEEEVEQEEKEWDEEMEEWGGGEGMRKLVKK